MYPGPPRVRLTGEQQQLREEVRRFAQEELEPQAIELGGAEERPTTILDGFGDRGYADITLPERMVAWEKD